MNVSDLEKLFSDLNESSKAIAFMTFAKQHNFTGEFTDTKEPLYSKTHKQGDLAGTTEAVQGARFTTTDGVCLMALSRNAAKIGLAKLMEAPATLQVRVDNYNGYQNFTLCTGQSDREAGSVSGTFTID